MAIVSPAPALNPEQILAALDPEQRAAACLPDGPAQIIAPAGSGKTTTMVARLAVLLSRGIPADRICVVTFNRDAAHDLAARVARRLGPQLPDARVIEIRTLHALARQVLLDSGEGANLIADRMPLLRTARRRCAAADPSVLLPEATQLDTWLSAWKVEGREPPIMARPVLDGYADLLRARGALDFDDLVVRAGELLQTDRRADPHPDGRRHQRCDPASHRPRSRRHVRPPRRVCGHARRPVASRRVGLVPAGRFASRAFAALRWSLTALIVAFVSGVLIVLIPALAEPIGVVISLLFIAAHLMATVYGLVLWRARTTSMLTAARCRPQAVFRLGLDSA